MKNFDTERQAREIPAEERTFVLGGETFIGRSSVRPEALTKWDGIGDDMPVTEVLKATDDTILALIEDTDNAHERYRALRQKEDDPLTIPDLVAVGTWLVEVQTGRPTDPPIGSTDSPSTPGTTSTDERSSVDTPEAQAA